MSPRTRQIGQAIRSASAGLRRSIRGVLSCAVVVGATAVGAQAAPLSGGTRDSGAINTTPTELNGIGITQRLNNKLPLDLTLTDENGKSVKLGDYFKPGKPVVLSLVYYECPMLCTYALNGEMQAFQKLDFVPGKEFEAVTVSFNPKDTPALATKKKANYVRELGKPEAAKGWAFLTGTEENVKKLADAMGFRYRWVPQTQQYAHASSLMVATPDGRLSRYMSGIVYDPKTLRMSIVEASGGKIGSFVDQVVLYCYLYDPTKGAYVPVPMRIMQLGGALTVLVLGTSIGVLLMREHKKKKLSHAQTQAS